MLWMRSWLVLAGTLVTATATMPTLAANTATTSRFTGSDWARFLSSQPQSTQERGLQLLSPSDPDQETSDEDELFLVSILQVGGFVDSSFCYSAIVTADADADGRITPEEYVALAQTLSPPGLIDAVTSFNELPFAFTTTFRNIACLCQIPSFGGDRTDVFCCTGTNAQIRVPSNPDGTTVTSDLAYLYAICSLTEGAAQSILTSPFPTVAPVQPTVAPTTSAPSSAPTILPTLVPTGVPTALPTLIPTLAATTMDPSGTPTIAPTAAVTTSTSEEPSIPSTSPPTEVASPTGNTITSTPTTTTTPAPSITPSVMTTTPSASPTQSPTPGIVTPVRPALVQYQIAVRNGLIQMDQPGFTAAYLSDLQVAMDEMVLRMGTTYGRRQLQLETTAGAATGSSSKGLRRHSPAARSLTTLDPVLQVLLPTQIPSVNEIDCPLSQTNVTVDLCQVITAAVPMVALQNVNGSAVELTIRRYEADLFNLIFDGKLQDELTKIRFDTPVVILTGLDNRNPPPAPDITANEPLSAGGIVGITVAAAVVVVAVYLVSRNRSATQSDRQAKYAEYIAEESEDHAPIALAARPPSSHDGSYLTDGAVQLTATGAASMLGAEKADYGTKYMQAMEAGEDLVAEPEGENYADQNRRGLDDDDEESSSNAGSSGWSSSAGISSLNTGSLDDSMDAAMAAGATLATLGVASGLTRSLNQSSKKATSPGGSGISSSAALSPPSSTQPPAVSPATNKRAVPFSALAAAAAMGGAAATMSAAHKDSTDSEDLSDMPAASREQLDHLIEAGDWAAVGATAALLAAASDSQSFSSRSRASIHSRDSGDVDAHRAAELDHLVDAGDWEGVVLAAAKYQAADADRDKRSQVSSVDSSGDSQTGTGTGGTGGSPSLSTSLSDSPSKASNLAEVRAEVEALVRRVVPEEIDNVDEMMNQFKGREDELIETLKTMQERAIAQKARAASHKAAKVRAKQSVQRGVVPGAEAAAQRLAIEATAPSNAETESTPAVEASPSWQREIDNLESAIEVADWESVGQAAAILGDKSQGGSSYSGSGSVVRRRNQLSTADAERATEIDRLVDAGDWMGVASAAQRFAEANRSPTLAADLSRMSQEEEEALRQAEVWMKIAEQKKAAGATDAGASDAAEWAIQRSLSQLRDAERQKAPEEGDQEVDEV